MKKMFGLLLTVFISFFGNAQTYNSLFWEITGNGIEKPSYLYGTLHAQDERVFQFKKGVMPAFKKADVYAMELNVDSINQGAMIQQLIMDSAYTLQSLLGERNYDRLNQFFVDSLGQTLFLYNKMQPIFVASMMGQRNLEKQRSEALDLYFHKQAKKQNKQVVGLEFMEEQIGAFKSISYQDQANMLIETLDHTDSTDAMMDEMLAAYMAGNLDQLLLLTEDSEYSGDEFVKVFLTDRNVRMVDRTIPLFEKGSVFIAVGAAHLPGEIGMIELLREKGYTVIAK